jgi:hypothetical protein
MCKSKNRDNVFGIPHPSQSLASYAMCTGSGHGDNHTLLLAPRLLLLCTFLAGYEVNFMCTSQQQIFGSGSSSVTQSFLFSCSFLVKKSSVACPKARTYIAFTAGTAIDMAPGDTRHFACCVHMATSPLEHQIIAHQPAGQVHGRW